MTLNASVTSRIAMAIRAQKSGNLKLAIRAMEQSLRRARKLGPAHEIEVLKPFAFMYYERKNFPKSRELFQQCLDLLGERVDVRADVERHTIYSVLGLMAYAEKNYREAERLHTIALELAIRTNNDAALSDLYVMLGVYAVEDQRPEDAIVNYEHALVGMQRRPADYGDRIRQAQELLVLLYGQCKKTSERDALRKKLLKDKVDKFARTAKSDVLPAAPKPATWAMDNVSDFLEVAQRNTEASFVLCKPLFESLVEKDAHFRIMHDAVVSYLGQRLREKYGAQSLKEISLRNEDWLEIYFFQQSQSSFLGAVRLALSGQVPQAQMVLRGLLENAMYGFRAHYHPQLKAIWLNRAVDQQAVKDNFKVKQIWEDFQNECPTLYQRIYSLYNKTVDDGAHPNANAFLQHASTSREDTVVRFTLTYLNPREVENCIRDTLACADVVLDVFDHIFDSISY